jgi:hypothetical protein
VATSRRSAAKLKDTCSITSGGRVWHDRGDLRASQLQHNSLVQFGSGGLSGIAAAGQLSLKGAGAQVQIADNSANNNALRGLSLNAGTFYRRNGAAAETTGLNNSNSLFLDTFGNDGGASRGVGDTLPIAVWWRLAPATTR